MRLTRWLLTLAWMFLPFVSLAGDAQIWHWWTNEFAFTPKVTVVLHGQFRTTRPLGEFLQARTGPIVRYYIAPKTSLAAGYYYRGEPNRQREGWGDSHRFFGGIENYKLLPETDTVPASLLETRFLVERFQGGPAGSPTNFTRFRHRNRFSFREWTVSPLIGYEIFFAQGMSNGGGFWAQRPHGGIRWQISNRMMLDVAYMWDGRSDLGGARNHLIFTNLLVRIKRDPESDFPNRPPF